MTDSQAFAELIQPHLAKLYRLAYRWTGTVPDAEDLVQDVLVKLYERRTELASIAALGSWSARVLYNRFLDETRSVARRRLVPVDAATAERLAVDAAEAAAVTPHWLDIKNLARGLAQLSLEHRTVLLMHDADGYKLEEIQEITGIPTGTVKSRLHRARARLRELLGGNGTF